MRHTRAGNPYRLNEHKLPEHKSTLLRIHLQIVCPKLPALFGQIRLHSLNLLSLLSAILVGIWGLPHSWTPARVTFGFLQGYIPYPSQLTK